MGLRIIGVRGLGFREWGFRDRVQSLGSMGFRGLGLQLGDTGLVPLKRIYKSYVGTYGVQYRVYRFYRKV